MDKGPLSELFESYGEAVFRAESLEKTISEILTGLSGNDEKLQNHRYSFFFDEKIDRNFKRLMNMLQSHFSLSGNTESELREALRKRNWLVLDYWWDRSVDSHDTEKIEWMKIELKSLSDHFMLLETDFRRMSSAKKKAD